MPVGADVLLWHLPAWLQPLAVVVSLLLRPRVAGLSKAPQPGVFRKASIVSVWVIQLFNIPVWGNSSNQK